MRTIRQLGDALGPKKVLMRVDFNVPTDKKSGRITNDLRIRQALPTIRYCVERGARTILMSHLGRPKGKRNPALSLGIIAERLSELLGSPVRLAPDCVGPDAAAAVDGMADGDVVMLENVRFHAQEEANDPAFAKGLAALGDVYVNDAFGTAHRAHASTEGIARLLPSCAGFLIEKEVAYLSKAVTNPEHPFVALLGGAKVSDKIEVIRNLLKNADSLLIGGAMAYTFLKSQGIPVGNSLVEDDKLDLAAQLLEEGGEKILLPVDHVCAADTSGEATLNAFETEITAGMIGLDIGSKTATMYESRIASARLVVWNGPMGYFEMKPFAEGTNRIAAALAGCAGTTIVGGGETAEAVEALGLQGKISHVSTGGGACLDFLAGKELPGLAALE